MELTNIVFDIDLIAMQECIRQHSNQPFWKKYEWRANKDLRAPQNIEKLREVLKRIKHSELLKIYIIKWLNIICILLLCIFCI